MRNREINFNISVKTNWGGYFCHCGVTADPVIVEFESANKMNIY